MKQQGRGGIDYATSETCQSASYVVIFDDFFIVEKELACRDIS